MSQIAPCVKKHTEQHCAPHANNNSGEMRTTLALQLHSMLLSPLCLAKLFSLFSDLAHVNRAQIVVPYSLRMKTTGAISAA